MKLIVGLGNPGPEYSLTRHNIGFMCIDHIVKGIGQAEQFAHNKKQHALTAKGNNLLFVKPQTFMNLSGRAVQSLSSFYKIPPSDIYVIHDEVDLEFGRVKIQIGGSSAGHNGIKSIIETLGTADFIRWRVGVGKPSKELNIDTADFVLQNISKEEQALLINVLTKVQESILYSLTNDIIATMNKYN